jgi:hypothetical protein
MILKFWRCFAVASASRHDHASGTLTVRPSASAAVIAEFVTLTLTMRGSLFTAMLIPCLLNRFPIGHDQCAYPIQLMRRKTIIARKRYGIKPKLADHSFSSHMYMLWLRAVKAVKEKSIRANDALYRRHFIALSLMQPPSRALQTPASPKERIRQSARKRIKPPR